MFPTLACLSKASRRPLTSKKANKDFYKGTRQSALPGGPYTGAPGKHVVRGKAKYRLVDEQVRVFIAPPIDAIRNSPLKPYVARGVHLTDKELLKHRSESSNRPHYWYMGLGPGGLSPQRYLRILQKYQHIAIPATLSKQVKKEAQHPVGGYRRTAIDAPKRGVGVSRPRV